jgi:KaiC/GvpD/RAD55 family RecA-like ATPase
MQKQELMLKTKVKRGKKPKEVEGKLAWKSGSDAIKEEPDGFKQKMGKIQLSAIELDKIEPKKREVRYKKRTDDGKLKPTQIKVKERSGPLRDQDKARILASKIVDLITLKTLTVMMPVLKQTKTMSMSLTQPIIIEKASFEADQIGQPRNMPPIIYHETKQSEGKIIKVSEKAEKTLTLIRSMLKETEFLTEKPLNEESIPLPAAEKTLEEEPPAPEKTSIEEKPPVVVKRSYIKRTQTGIPGLDDLIEGGFAIGDLITIAGKAGTGKSTLAMQFLVQGALEHGESGVYVTFIEDAATLRRNSASFGWDIKSLEKANKIKIVDGLPSMPLDALVKTLQKTIASINAKRLVIDSITSLVSNSQTSIDPKAFTKLLYQSVKKDGCITLLITGIDDEENLSFGIEEIVDGIIILETVLEGNGIKRRAIIRKMRGTEHNMTYQDVTISNDGLVFKPMPTGRIPKIY